MADRGGDNNPFQAWPLMIALAAAIGGGVFFWPSPLKSSRPGGSSQFETNSFGEQTVEARLWQDPFEAIQPSVEEWLTNGPTNTHNYGAGEISRQIQARLPGPGANDIVIFQVMVPGGPYAENKESRLRSRYAVVSALQAAGYVSCDEDHVGWFGVPWLRSADFERSTNVVPRLQESAASDQRLFIPYEWFQRDAHPLPKTELTHGAILVWWLRDDAFNDHPLQRLAQLRAWLGEAGSGAASNPLDFKLINPELGGIFSDDPEILRLMSISCVGGSTQSVPVPITNFLTNLEMYSAWSTTADALVWTNATGERREAISNELARLGVAFHNVTCTDDQLATNLVHELKLRGVDLANEKHSVALIAERDTEYGRSLPLTFAAALNLEIDKLTHFKHKLTNFNEALAWTETHDWPSNVYCFSYLRGIDGLLPEQSAPKPETEKDTSGNGQEKSKSQLIADLERPEGQSQLDYMPRLAQALKDLEREGALPGHRHKPLRAIGVLGSDVYDKLLLLQSLHNQFPDVIFFTTDLDARLFHPSELKWSRNLVVASSFGLQLGEPLQKDVPPFRDTYQTGEYLACLAALGNPEASTNLALIRPRLFEIGRRGPYALDVDSAQRAQSSHEDPFYRLRPAAFDRPGSGWSAAAIALGGLLMGGCCIGIYFKRETAGFRRSLVVIWLRYKDVRHCSVFVSILVAILGIVLFVTIGWQHQSQDGEPFSLFDGVSIWPCEIVRFMAFTLAIVLFAVALIQVRSSNRALQKEFRLRPGGISGVERLFMRYVKSGRLRRRLGRILLLVLCYMPLGGGIVMEFGLPFVPYRGPVSKVFDINALCLSVLIMLWLMFFVVDTSLRSVLFIQDLSRKAAQWPAALLQQYCLPGTAVPGAGDMGVDEWLTIQFIAKRTAVIGKLIYYPFIVLLAMILARISFFARFSWPLSLILIFGLISLFVFGLALALHLTAAQARKMALERLERKLVAARCMTPSAADQEAIQMMMDKINDVDRGAFAPLSQQPFIRAVLLPFGGAIMAWLQSLAQ